MRLDNEIVYMVIGPQIRLCLEAMGILARNSDRVWSLHTSWNLMCDSRIDARFRRTVLVVLLHIAPVEIGAEIMREFYTRQLEGVFPMDVLDGHDDSPIFFLWWFLREAIPQVFVLTDASGELVMTEARRTILDFHGDYGDDDDDIVYDYDFDDDEYEAADNEDAENDSADDNDEHHVPDHDHGHEDHSTVAIEAEVIVTGSTARRESPQEEEELFMQEPRWLMPASIGRIEAMPNSASPEGEELLYEVRLGWFYNGTRHQASLLISSIGDLNPQGLYLRRDLHLQPTQVLPGPLPVDMVEARVRGFELPELLV